MNLKVQSVDSIVFGSNGQDGYLMTRYLLKKNRKVVAISRSHNQNILKLRDRYKLLKVISLKKFNKQNYNKIVTKYKFKYIFFFAGFSKIPKSDKDKNICKVSNFRIFKDLLEVCEKKKIRPKILYTSSGEIFGSNQYIKKTENSKLVSNNCYAQCKIKLTNLINDYRKFKKFFIVNAICYNHESIFTPKDHLLRKLINKFNDKKNYSIVISNPFEKRNISHTYDFLPMFEKSLIRDKSDNYIFANSRNISVQQIAKQINKKYKKKITYVNRNSNISRMADNSKIKKLLNYNPKFTNKKIIMRMLSYHRRNIYI